MILEDDFFVNNYDELDEYIINYPNDFGIQYLTRRSDARGVIRINSIVETIKGQFGADGYIINSDCFDNLINICDPMIDRKDGVNNIDGVLAMKTDNIKKYRPIKEITKLRVFGSDIRKI